METQNSPLHDSPSQNLEVMTPNSQDLCLWSKSQGLQFDLKTEGVVGPGLKTGGVVGPKDSTDRGI